MGRVVASLSGIGGVIGVIGAVQLVRGTHGVSAWGWLCAGLAVIAVSQVVVVQRAISPGAASGGASQTMFSLAEGASIHGFAPSRLSMQIGDNLPAASTSRRRWRTWLDIWEREDLADRCEACGTEILEMMYRPEPAHVARDDWVQHASETRRRFAVDYAARARDLINECVEAGFSIDRDLEEFRQRGSLAGAMTDEIGQGLGVLGRRVRRDARKF